MGSVLSTFIPSFPSEEQQFKGLHFNQLNEDIIFEIFSQITPTELLASERVDKRWQRMVQETLQRRVKTVAMKPLEQIYMLHVCKHLKESKKKTSIEKMFDDILKRKLGIAEEVLGRKVHDIFWYEGLFHPKDLQAFVSCLSKLRGVKSIDFAELHIKVLTLVQAFELCPNLECVKIGSAEPHRGFAQMDEEEWIKFVDNFGHRLVHFSMYNVSNSQELFLCLGKSADKLQHLKMIGFRLNNVTEEIGNIIKQLQQPKNAYVAISFYQSQENGLIDSIDEILAEEFFWNALPDNCQRLALLRFKRILPQNNVINQFKQVNFAALRKLFLEEVTGTILQVLSRSRFPLLEELKLVFNREVVIDVDNLMEPLFDRTPALAKFTVCDKTDVQHQVPGPAVLRLRRLNEISWRVIIWPTWALQVMVGMFDVLAEIVSLKKLKFEYIFHREVAEPQKNEWLQFIGDQLNVLQEKRPELAVESSELTDHWNFE